VGVASSCARPHPAACRFALPRGSQAQRPEHGVLDASIRASSRGVASGISSWQDRSWHRHRRAL